MTPAGAGTRSRRSCWWTGSGHRNVAWSLTEYMSKEVGTFVPSPTRATARSAPSWPMTYGHLERERHERRVDLDAMLGIGAGASTGVHASDAGAATEGQLRDFSREDLVVEGKGFVVEAFTTARSCEAHCAERGRSWHPAPTYAHGRRPHPTPPKPSKRRESLLITGGGCGPPSSLPVRSPNRGTQRNPTFRVPKFFGKRSRSVTDKTDTTTAEPRGMVLRGVEL